MDARVAAAAIRALSRVRPAEWMVEAATYRLGRRLARRASGELVSAALSGGAIALGYLEHPDYRRAWIRGTYEPELTALFGSVVSAGDVAIDVGANIGLHALTLAALVGPQGRVHAFEPVPAAADVLQASVEANGYGERVAVHRVAVSDAAGELTMWIGDGGGVTSSLIAHEWLVAENKPLTVQVTTLDDVLLPLLDRAPRLMKVDVEGKERDVLQGATELLARFPPEVLVLEFTSTHPGEAAVELVSELGYSPVELGGSSLRPAPIALPPVNGSGPGDPDFAYVNVVFSRRS
jgi:FkbM family methyltransferase